MEVDAILAAAIFLIVGGIIGYALGLSDAKKITDTEKK